MLRLWLVVPLAALCQKPSGAAAEPAVFVLPLDNDRGRYRMEAANWSSEWPAPMLLSGEEPRGLTLSDKALHRMQEPSPFGIDFLYPFEFELGFQGSSICAVCRRFWWASYLAAGLYIVGLFLGQGAMKDRQGWDVKWPLAAWNLFLAVYSLIGAVRTVPHLLMILVDRGFDYSVCRAGLPMYGSGACGLWVALFIFSKYFELIDTVFLVVRKRPVGFLHWYHHFSVLLYTWHAYIWETPTGIYFVSMNYSVHAIMYFYYFLAGVSKPPRWALLVTILQLSQMAGGIYTTLSHLYRLHYRTIPLCDGHMPNLILALVMYSTYFYLFGEFLLKRYCRRKPSNGTRSSTGNAKDASPVDGKATNGKKHD